LKKKYSNEEIMTLYYNNKINFEFKKRYDNTIQRIKEKEKVCDIKITHLFTLENIQKIKLMHTNNHPTNYVIKYLTNEILKILNLNTYSFSEIKTEILSKTTYSFYSYNYYKFEWMKSEDTEESCTLKMLNNILYN